MARVRQPSNIKEVRGISLSTVIFAIAVFVISGYLLYNEFSGNDDEPETNTASSGLSSAAYAPAMGPADAPVVLAKWTDFQ
jgi:hypothetical protein